MKSLESLQLPNLTQDYPEANDDQRPTWIDTKTPEDNRRLGEKGELTGPNRDVGPAGHNPPGSVGHGSPRPAGPAHFWGGSPPLPYPPSD